MRTIGEQPEKKQKIQELCKQDLRFLCEKVLEMRWSHPFHTELAEFLENSGDRKLVLTPRGHQKTSIVTVGWTIQQLLRNSNERVLIVSAGWDLSRNILYQISNYLSSGVLPQLFGNFQTPQTRWTKDEVDIAQRTSRVVKDPSIRTAGIETGKTGSHCSLLIFDDIVAAENVTTKEQIQKVINAYRECLPLLDPGGRLVFIGTRWAMGDVYGHIMQTDMRSLNGHEFETEEEKLKWREFVKQ